MRLHSLPLPVIRVTSQYGPRDLTVSGVHYWWHNGIDLAATIGQPVYAAASGRVMVAKNNAGGYGLYIVIEHSDCCTLYAHLSQLIAREGTEVKAGELIAYSGNTGASTGPHLHFELRQGAYKTFWDRCKTDNSVFMRTVDPLPYISAVIRREKLTEEEAERVAQELLGVDDNTMKYFSFYRYGKELIAKIGKALI